MLLQEPSFLRRIEVLGEMFPVSECALTKAIRKLIISKSVRGATTWHPRIIISQIFLRTDTKERITIGVLKCNQSSYHLVSCWIFVYCSKKQTLANIS